MTQTVPQILLPGTEGQNRQDFIGGSDAHHVLGLEPWGCPLALVLEKGGVPTDDPEPPAVTKDMDRGKLLEPLMRQLFIRDTGVAVAHDGPILEQMAQWAQAPGYLRVHLDGLMDAPTPAQWSALGGTGAPPDGPGVYEGKVPRSAAFWRMKRDGPRLGYLAQVHHGMIITGTRWGMVQASEADGLQHLRWMVRWDDTLAADYLAAASRLWAKALEVRGAGVGALPTPEARHDALKALPQLPPRLEPNDARCRRCPRRRACHGEAYKQALDLEAIGPGEQMARMDDDPAWRAAVAKYLEFDEIREDAAMHVDAAKEAIKCLLGSRTLAEGAGVRVTWREHSQERVDSALLKKKYPDVAAAVTKRVTQKPLRINPI